MPNLPPGMRVCPTRVDGTEVLFAHTVTPPMCQHRQREQYHKCFTCVHNNARSGAPAVNGTNGFAHSSLKPVARLPLAPVPPLVYRAS
jgi:hypothetical protein